MDRSTLEFLQINQLRSLASRLSLSTSGTRAIILERIVNFYESQGKVNPSEMDHATGGYNSGGTGANVPPQETPPPRSAPTQIGQNTALNIDDIVRAVVQVMDAREQSRREERRLPPLERGSSATNSESSSSANKWSQIKFATKMIPIFSGKDEENIQKWIERIASVARLYNLGDDVLIVAAITQLKDRALDWYNRQELESVSTWEDFKYHIRRHFEIKESYTATLARIGQRIWKAQSEKFIDYAENKLTLMQTLSLSEKEKIDLLADGVKDPVLRKLVLSTWINNIPDFLEHVRRITEDITLPKNNSWNIRFGGRGNLTNRNQSSRPLNTEIACFNCKQAGPFERLYTKEVAFKNGSLFQMRSRRTHQLRLP